MDHFVVRKNRILWLIPVFCCAVVLDIILGPGVLHGGGIEILAIMWLLIFFCAMTFLVVWLRKTFIVVDGNKITIHKVGTVIETNVNAITEVKVYRSKRKDYYYLMSLERELGWFGEEDRFADKFLYYLKMHDIKFVKASHWR